MHNSVDNLIAIQKEIQLKISKNKISNKLPEIIAVSKTFKMENIIPLINHGHLNFGENKVQESLEKWSSIKNDFQHIKLHMIGKLQTNKVKYAISLFDYIHSLDNLKLAEKIANEQKKQNKSLKIFIQVNIGNEQQKAGVLIEKIESFYIKCTKELGLDIIGLMCLPPINKVSNDCFSVMQKLSKKINVNNLSMGMSNDYIEAVKNGSTHLRIGSKIFGKRN